MFSKIDNLKKIIVKYYLEEYFGIQTQVKVVDLELYIPLVFLDLQMLSLIFFDKF